MIPQWSWVISSHNIRPNKKIPVFRITRPYLNLLVKPRFFSGFLETNIILCILKGKIIYIFQKKKLTEKKNNVCVPYLKFSDRLPRTHLFLFIWPSYDPSPYTISHAILLLSQRQTVWALIRLLILRQQSDLGPYYLQYRLSRYISR